MSRKILFVPFVVFSVLMGMVVHEGFHWVEYYIHDMNPREICFIGYNPRGNYAGWVRYNNEIKSAFNSNEIFANFLTVTISLMTFFLLLMVLK